MSFSWSATGDDWSQIAPRFEVVISVADFPWIQDAGETSAIDAIRRVVRESAASALPDAWAPIVDDVEISLSLWDDSQLDLTVAFEPVIEGLRLAGVFVDNDQIAGESFHRYRREGAPAAGALVDESRPSALAADADVVVIHVRSGEDAPPWQEPPSRPLVGLAAEDLDSYFPLPAGALLLAVGIRFYPEAVERLQEPSGMTLVPLTISSRVAEEVAAREQNQNAKWFDVKLVPEPDNPHDANAIGVISPCGQVGHLSAELASEFADVFDALRELGYKGAVIPGFLDPDTGRVVLVLSYPSICLPSINAEWRKRAWQAWQRGIDKSSDLTRYGFADISSFLRGARQHARENNLAMPPTASELARRLALTAR
jgi:HIRAN domain-containing protein